MNFDLASQSWWESVFYCDSCFKNDAMPVLCQFHKDVREGIKQRAKEAEFEAEQAGEAEEQ